MTLTDLAIRKTAAPAKGRLELWDDKPKGLVLRVTATGVRSWSVFYRHGGVNRRLTLGRYRPEESKAKGLTLGEARDRARKVLRQIDDGIDPQAEKVQAREVAKAAAQRQGATFSTLAARWLASTAAAEWRPKTRAEFTRIVNRELVPVLGDLEPEAVTKAHIRALYDRLAERSESIAKHTLAVLRLLYLWASEEDHVDAVPAFPKRGTQSNRRERVLTEDELRRVWTALATTKKDRAGTERPHLGPLGEAFRLLLLTGQRRGEVLSMRWSDVTEEHEGTTTAAWWTIPADRHKSGRAHRVPLTQPAVDALARLHNTQENEWVFPSPKGTGRLAERARRAGLEPPMPASPFVANPQKAASELWTLSGLRGSAHLHDLRRTVATNLARLGIGRLVIGRVLGHSDSDVTGRYDVFAYDREKRAALAKWAEELERITSARNEAKAAKKVLPWRA